MKNQDKNTALQDLPIIIPEQFFLGLVIGMVVASLFVSVLIFNSLQQLNEYSYKTLLLLQEENTQDK
ncbi:MAG: hypothetical protein QY330_01530 [Candidatus Dojkabacteria bacterium]|uniref:Uncharacterized protein n=1 Tax=candidate division WS6 bacterium OLB21 TaxID=1617427 RepID=A0A136KJ85_9BACT|nr:MAG: hypothetical protein UZ20_WS6002000518 [candidate division WS6 bacterium OLB21]WKZ28270.1 MAG: hypothetical protein QY330_01530 [Candidatus Dojkabacteria bacterium]